MWLVYKESLPFLSPLPLPLPLPPPPWHGCRQVAWLLF